MSFRIEHPGRRGFTLIEFAIAISVIIVIAVPILSVYSAGQSAARSAEASATAVLLARELLEEAASRAFEEPGTSGGFGREAGESARSRSAYDDVDDYDGYGPHDPPLDLFGNDLSDFSGFSRSVSVENVDGSDFGSVRPMGSTPFKRIVVRVVSRFPGEADVSLETVVARS